VISKREGWQGNVKRVHRLYLEQGLSLRIKRPKRNKSARLRQSWHVETDINQIYSMDFVADAMFSGRNLQTLTAFASYEKYNFNACNRWWKDNLQTV
jgi:putative transposase